MPCSKLNARSRNEVRPKHKGTIRPHACNVCNRTFLFKQNAFQQIDSHIFLTAPKCEQFLAGVIHPDSAILTQNVCFS